MTLFGISFLAPLALAGLLALPVLYWLMRAVPPAPKTQFFPPARLLRELREGDPPRARTPWWLILLRLLALSAAIVGMAQPVDRSPHGLPGSGPVVLLIDNGYPAAPDWSDRVAVLEGLIADAAAADRPIRLLPLASGPDGAPPTALGPLTPAQASQRLAGLEPQPWPARRQAGLAALEMGDIGPDETPIWLTDGSRDAGGTALAAAVSGAGGEVLALPASAGPVLLEPPRQDPAGWRLRAHRLTAGPAGETNVRARDADGRILADLILPFAERSLVAEIPVALGADRERRTRSLVVEGTAGAGTHVLLDHRWQRRRIALIGEIDNPTQPLLSPLHYIDRALAPYSDFSRAPLDSVLGEQAPAGPEPDIIILADRVLSGRETSLIGNWLDGGGLLIRFAGPRLAAASDGLLPVELRGGRALAGTMSWTEPREIGSFADDGPFSGLTADGDVVVHSQVLAEPGPELSRHVWASLTDGTPLVTGRRQGEGWVVLFHVTADAEWSSLALSGLFVEMLRRLLPLASGGQDRAAGPLRPVEVLDGWGFLGAPGAAARSLDPGRGAASAGPAHPPGLYAADGTGTEAGGGAIAVNLADLLPQPPRALPAGAVSRIVGPVERRDWAPYLILAGALLLILDLLISLRQRGLLLPARAALLVGLLGAPLAAPGPAEAQFPELSPSFADAANSTYLGFVLTGDADLDAGSRAGLEGLVRRLLERTTIEASGAVGVDPARDELALFPMLYWPLRSGAAPHISEAGIDRINAYMRAGGMVIIDTGRPHTGWAGGGPLLPPWLGSALDMPPLVPIPPDHMLTRTFYLLAEFPGRYAGAPLWVSADQEQTIDGVSPAIIGSADWAGAWATDGNGAPRYPISPGGERQREFAIRFGVNLAMYALTGNYKSDQVHVPAILERLTQ